MGQPAIGACRTGRSTGGRSELGGACRFAPVVSQRVRARWSGSWSYVVRRVLWYACRGGRTFTAAASKWPTICNVTNGTAVGRRLLRWPLRAQLLCMSLAKNAVMMAPRAWRRSALSEDFQPFHAVAATLRDRQPSTLVLLASTTHLRAEVPGPWLSRGLANSYLSHHLLPPAACTSCASCTLRFSLS